MSRQYRDGKPFKPKPKAPKRKSVEESVNEQNIALLRQKLNLIKDNIADDFLDENIRKKMVLERAKKLKNLNAHELLMRLAETELHLETTLFLYDETYKQKQFLEDSYLKSGEERLVGAANKTAGKAKVQSRYTHIKETAWQILDGMKEKDFRLFCRKMRAKFFADKVSDGTLRNYFKEITGLESTK